MRDLQLPTDEAGWERLAAAVVKANLTLAGMSYRELQDAFVEMGLRHGQKDISAKLRRQKLSAAFMLQCLVAAGVTTLQLPRRHD